MIQFGRTDYAPVYCGRYPRRFRNQLFICNWSYHNMAAALKSALTKKNFSAFPEASKTDSHQTYQRFDIRNFSDRLVPAKEKNKYICPVCQGHNLGIEPNTGKYKCFNDCESAAIREALSPWGDRGNRPNKVFATQEQPKTLKQCPIPDGKFVIARLESQPNDVPKPIKPTYVPPRVLETLGKKASLVELEQISQTRYEYGDGKVAHRFECPAQASPKKKEKTFCVSHTDAENQQHWSKGPQPWKAYRQDEAVAAMKKITDGIAVLLHQEGEKCVEAGRTKRISSMSTVGSTSHEALTNTYKEIKAEMGEHPFLIAYCMDNDPTGEKKALAAAKAASEAGVPFVSVALKDIQPDLCEKGDIADILETGMDPDELVALLCQEIEKQATQQKTQEVAEAEVSQESPQVFVDFSDPELLYKPICEILGIEYEDCVTAGTFDNWAFHRIFTSAQDWRVIDSAFYRWSEMDNQWQHRTDGLISAIIADAGEQAFKLSYSDRFGWQVRKPYGTNSHKESAFKYVRSRLERPEPLPCNTHLLAFRNCVVDLRTGQQLPHDKNHFLTHLVPYDYKPGLACPEVFRRFVADSFGEEMLEVIRAFTSMFLDPTAPYGRFPHLIGQSGGGKGTLGRFWSSLFGDDGFGAASQFADISTPEGRHQYLTGKRIFGFPDLGGYAEGVRAFYELVDNGCMSGRALYNPVAYSKQWFVRFWIASVDHLQIENAGDGWVRRAYPIPVRSRSVAPDPDLRQKLEDVKADVISWALAMPREERDLILLSPPQEERAVNAMLDAALYGDSTKSFVDLCLRPSREPGNIPHHLLHTWYVSYCKEHGYTPLGMSKFISHLKTILPKHFVDRQWTPMVNGQRERIPAHWEYLVPVPGVFVSWASGFHNSGENPSAPQQENWSCMKSLCIEGGLEDFDDFWQCTLSPQPDVGAEQPKEEERPRDGEKVQTSIPSTEMGMNNEIPFGQESQNAHPSISSTASVPAPSPMPPGPDSELPATPPLTQDQTTSTFCVGDVVIPQTGKFQAKECIVSTIDSSGIWIRPNTRGFAPPSGPYTSFQLIPSQKHNSLTSTAKTQDIGNPYESAVPEIWYLNSIDEDLL